MFSVLRKKAPLLGAFFVFGMLAGPVQAFCPALETPSRAVVRQVVDGDTLRLDDGRRVRLVGINAPELSGQGRTVEPFAEPARERLRQLVGESAGQVGLVVVGKDHYGRTLAHVYGRDHDNLEARLLADGLGYFVAFSPASGLRECQQAAERHARAGRLGVWRKAAARAPEQIVAGGFVLVQGRVSRVEENRGGLWLELNGSLVLRVKPELLEHFDAGMLRSLAGRRVEARGWVVDRARKGAPARQQARWMLALTHPAMLEILP